MFRIAICDNEQDDLNGLYEMIREYAQEQFKTEYDIISYNSPQKLAEELKHKPADLYFLDVIMPEVDGIELGTRIRGEYEQAVIVYTTSSREFAFDAFGVKAADYIEKPVSKEQVVRNLEEAFSLKSSRQKKILIRSKAGDCSIALERIVSVENESRSSVYTLINGEKIIGICNRSSFENSVGELLQESCFVQTHKSYIVNMNYIAVLKNGALIMENDETIPVSRERMQEVKRRYMQFVLGKD